MTGSNKKSPGVGSQELTAAISAILAVTGTASAQDQQSSGATLEEVIVTATKREERLQDVPESITAIGSDDILKRGLLQMEDSIAFVAGRGNQIRATFQLAHVAPARVGPDRWRQTVTACSDASSTAYHVAAA